MEPNVEDSTMTSDDPAKRTFIFPGTSKIVFTAFTSFGAGFALLLYFKSLDAPIPWKQCAVFCLFCIAAIFQQYIKPAHALCILTCLFVGYVVLYYPTHF